MEVANWARAKSATRRPACLDIEAAETRELLVGLGELSGEAGCSERIR